jgi:signal transduction histidine kinase
LGYRNLLNTGYGQIVLACLVALATHKRANTLTLTLWLGYLLLAGLGYLALHRYFAPMVQQSGPNPAGVRHWYRLRRSLQVISSMGWGCLGFLLVPDATAHNVMVMTAFAGVVGHSAAGNSANDFLGFVISGSTIVLMLLLRVPAIFGEDALSIMLMCIFYVTALTTVLRNTHNSLRESIRLRLAHAALAVSNASQAALAEKANRDKSEFLAAASHDLRQPVHALLLLIEAYRQQVPTAVNHPLMKNIAQAGHDISHLFNALMELSRLESGTEKPISSEFDLTPLLRDLLERSQTEALQKGLLLRSRQSSRLPSTWVCTDSVLLQRILGNLLTNALRYTAQGGLLLSLRQAHGQAGIWLEVWDTGIGISAADQGRIFDPYVQIANRERDRSKGLGLGLAIVQHACELLGLQIEVRSQPQRGTRFRLTLPAQIVRATPPAKAVHLTYPASASSVLQTASWLMGRRVLLVEDDPLVQVAMQSLLTGWQMEVRCATRGDASVLESCSEHWQPECVLCDFRLPGELNGIEVLDLLQLKYPKAIGVLITGELLQTVQQAADDAGYLLLCKPVDTKVLAFTLETLLDRRNEERDSHEHIDR